MLQTQEKPLEFLADALSAMAAQDKIEQDLKALSQEADRLNKSLEQTRKTMQEQMNSTVSKRRAELLAGYNEQLAQLESKIKKSNAAREKAKNQGVKERIASETEELWDEIRALKGRITSVFEQAHVPGFCKLKLYYLLFYPQGFVEHFWHLTLLCLIFLGAPFGFWLYIYMSRYSWWIFLGGCVLYLFVVGGIFLAINNSTRIRYAEALKEAQKLRAAIKGDKKKIAAITHAIKTDKDEGSYDLKVYDDELAKNRQALQELSQRKQEAQNTFENVTKNILEDEIEAGFRDELGALESQLAAARQQSSDLEEQQRTGVLRLSTEFEPFLGHENMDAESVEQLRQLLTTQEAGSLMEAQKILLSRRK